MSIPVLLHSMLPRHKLQSRLTDSTPPFVSHVLLLLITFIPSFLPDLNQDSGLTCPHFVSSAYLFWLDFNSTCILF